MAETASASSRQDEDQVHEGAEGASVSRRAACPPTAAESCLFAQLPQCLRKPRDRSPVRRAWSVVICGSGAAW